MSKTDSWRYADRLDEDIEARITPNGSPCSGRPQSILPNIIQAVGHRDYWYGKSIAEFKSAFIFALSLFVCLV